MKGCICVDAVDDCQVNSYAKTKVDVLLFERSRSVLLIQSPGHGKSRTVYLKPFLPTDTLGQAILDKYLCQSRTITEWQSVFHTVGASIKQGVPALVIAKQSMMVGFSTEAITLCVKCHQYLDDSMEVETESSTSLFEPVHATELPSKLLGWDEAKNLSAVVSLWPNLVTNVAKTCEDLAKLDSGIKMFKVTLSDDIDNLEDKIAADQTLIGNRPESEGTSTIWESIADMKALMNNIQGAVQASSGFLGDLTTRKFTESKMLGLLEENQEKWEWSLATLKVWIQDALDDHITWEDAHELFN